VTEVRVGYECGMTLAYYSDIKIDDIIETYELREKPRSESLPAPTCQNRVDLELNWVLTSGREGGSDGLATRDEAG
jgi:hypothetical protein